MTTEFEPCAETTHGSSAQAAVGRQHHSNGTGVPGLDPRPSTGIRVRTDNWMVVWHDIGSYVLTSSSIAPSIAEAAQYLGQW